MTEEVRAVPDDGAGASAEPRERKKRVRTPEQVVRNYQARIVKATEQGRWNKVKTLQYRLSPTRTAPEYWRWSG